jgi:hypothetical protein
MFRNERIDDAVRPGISTKRQLDRNSSQVTTKQTAEADGQAASVWPK